MPGLPGAACSSVSAGLCARRHASACSRAPEPTTSTFTRASLLPGFDDRAAPGHCRSCRNRDSTSTNGSPSGSRSSRAPRVADRGALRGRRPVGRMMEARGFPLEEPEGEELTEPETVRDVRGGAPGQAADRLGRVLRSRRRRRGRRVLPRALHASCSTTAPRPARPPDDTSGGERAAVLDGAASTSSASRTARRRTSSPSRSRSRSASTARRSR